MPPIDAADVMQAFADLFCGDPGAARTATPPEAPESFLRPPRPGLDGAPRDFTAVYGPEGRLLMHLAQKARDGGDDAMAARLTALQTLLDNPDFLAASAPKRAERLVDFVYPVI